MGLACGCPARFGFAGGRSGCDGDAGADGAPGRIGGLGPGILGKLGAAGRGTPGAIIAAGGFGASPNPAGSGCLGPERIWPGLGGGTGLAGIAEPLDTGFEGTGMDGACAAGEVVMGKEGVGGGGATRGGAGCGIGIEDGAWPGVPDDRGGRSGGATVEKLGAMTPEQLEEIPGVDQAMVENIQSAVVSYYRQFEEEAPEETAPEETAAEEPSEETVVKAAENESDTIENTEVQAAAPDSGQGEVELS